jgi:hypothetical protein
MVKTIIASPPISFPLGSNGNRIDWQGIVIPKVQYLLTEYPYHPTIRGIFYRLVSDNIITNVFKNYKGFIQALSIAREKDSDEKGYLDVYAFADDTRFIEEIDDAFWSPEEFIDFHVEQLKDAHNQYLQNGYFTRWHNQPNYVEVMIEKNALRGAFKDVLKSAFDDEVLSVSIVPNNGWSSKVYRRTNIDRLHRHMVGRADNGEGPKDVYVLYFGDYDPTGLRMSYNIGRDLERIGIHFLRVGLNKDHISEYGLDHLRNPEPDVMAKLQNDPNREGFKADNNGELFQIELDALQKNSSAFRDLILKFVKFYYNESIYEENLRKLGLKTGHKIANLVNKKVKFLD